MEVLENLKTVRILRVLTLRLWRKKHRSDLYGDIPWAAKRRSSLQTASVTCARLRPPANILSQFASAEKTTHIRKVQLHMNKNALPVPLPSQVYVGLVLGAKSPPRRPKTRPRGSQDAPGTPPGAPRTPQETPKTPPRHPKTQRRPRFASSCFYWSCCTSPCSLHCPLTLFTKIFRVFLQEPSPKHAETALQEFVISPSAVKLRSDGTCSSRTVVL